MDLLRIVIQGPRSMGAPSLYDAIGSASGFRKREMRENAHPLGNLLHQMSLQHLDSRSLDEN